MKNVVKTDQAPGAIGPYSQGIQVGDMYFFSGQIPLLPSSFKKCERIIRKPRIIIFKCC